MLSFLKPVVYIQISPERLMVRNAKSGETISETPALPLPDGSIVNPFSHPRTLVSDFTGGQQLVSTLLRRLGGSSVFRVAPSVVMHPLGDPAGGYTQIEIRALHEMALGGGASEAIVWVGRPLTDQELLAREFPSDGQVLS